MRDIAVGPNGDIWAVSKDESSSRFGGYVYKWDTNSPRSNKWIRKDGSYGKRIAVDASGSAWIVNKAGNVFY
jgi:hypothetical protein